MTVGIAFSITLGHGSTFGHGVCLYFLLSITGYVFTITLGHGVNDVVMIFGHGYVLLTNVRGMFLVFVPVMGASKTITNDDNSGPKGPWESEGGIVSI